MNFGRGRRASVLSWPPRRACGPSERGVVSAGRGAVLRCTQSQVCITVPISVVEKRKLSKPE